jgi:hypothetical protein
VQDNVWDFGWHSSDTPVLDAQGAHPYILLILPETRTIRTVSLVGDYAFVWLTGVTAKVLQDGEYFADGSVAVMADLSRDCLPIPGDFTSFNTAGGDAFCNYQGSAVLLIQESSPFDRVGLSNVAIYTEEENAVEVCEYDTDYD